jgi:EAL domain-containing protein (putative c-di-GMP-specific phosphodiesterase class I)
MLDPDRAIAVLQSLAERGFPLTIDDFGTGFSSLAYLRDLPVSTVKIDKHFVLDLPHQVDDANLVRGTVDLVHVLGKTVVAEGVETLAAVDFLRQAGCDHGQGYHWSRAVPPAELAAWARARRPPAPRLRLGDRQHLLA